MTDPNPNPNPSPPWHDGIDAETMGHWQNKGWKTDDPKVLATELTKAWKGLEKHFGAPADQILRLPKDAADEAGWRGVRERLGAPREAKDYDFSAIKGQNGADLDAAFQDTMRAALHKAGVAKDSAPEIVRAVIKQQADAAIATKTERDVKVATERTELQREWGQKWDENRLTAMRGASRAAGSDEAAVKLIDGMQQQIGYRATMEFFRRIGAGTSEDVFQDGGPSGGKITTRSGAQARLVELEADPAWRAKLTKGDAAAAREMNDLIAQIHGGL